MEIAQEMEARLQAGRDDASPPPEQRRLILSERGPRAATPRAK